ncbi:hypothetical protein HYQ44_001722 [Verticillium longisporum]|nr:hypothetical protein HYQ44_001722 [Verticillium longisporum]
MNLSQLRLANAGKPNLPFHADARIKPARPCTGEWTGEPPAAIRGAAAVSVVREENHLSSPKTRLLPAAYQVASQKKSKHSNTFRHSHSFLASHVSQQGCVGDGRGLTEDGILMSWTRRPESPPTTPPPPPLRIFQSAYMVVCF